jgi:histone deacetylase 1/2
MSAFHSPEYIEHLKHVSPSLLEKNKVGADKSQALADFKVGENDCPCFEGMYEFF